jgi:hypothetical protein
MAEPSVVEIDTARSAFRRAIEEITRVYGPGSEETAALGMLTFAAHDFMEVAGKERTLEMLDQLRKTIADDGR